MSIVYLDYQIQDKIINAECVDCSGDEALTKLLEGTSLIWVRNGDQYIIQALTDVLPNGYEISGYVRDKSSKEFIPFANVFIKNSFIGDISNESGYFSLINVMTDICTLTISYIGYKPENKIIRWADVKDKLIHIELTPRVISTLGITVKGEYLEYMDQTSEPNRISFSPRHINSLPKLGETDLFRSLQLLPGVLVGNAGSAGLYIRGGTPDQNLILLDGISIYQMDHFFGFYSSINASSVKDIQLYKGGYPAKYGGRVSSVITMTGKTGNTDQTKYNLNLNLLSTGLSIELPLFGRGSIFLSTRSSYSDFYKTRLYDKIYNFLTSGKGLNIGGENQNPEYIEKSTYMPDFSFQDINGKLMLLPSEKDILSISYYRGQDNLIETRDYIFADTAAYTTGSENIETIWGNEGIGLRWSRKWNLPLYSKFYITRSNYKSMNHANSEWINIDFFNHHFSNSDTTDTTNFTSFEENIIEDNTVRLENELSISNSHQLDFGFWYKNIKTHFKSILSDTLPISNLKMEGNLYTFYITDGWKVKNKLIIDLGLRTSHFNNTDKMYYEPRISLKLAPSNTTNFHGHWGKYYQFMHRFSSDYVSNGSKFVWMLSNDNLKPISSIHNSIGFQYLTPELTLSLEIFQRLHDGLADFSHIILPEDPYILPQSVRFGDGNVKGIELMYHRRTSKINGWFSYNYTKSENVFPDLNDGKNFLADHDRTHELKSVATTSVGNWNLSLSWFASTGRLYTPTGRLEIFENDYGKSLVATGTSKNTERLEYLDRLDFALSYNLSFSSSNLEIGLSIINCLNRKNISHRRYTFFKDSEDKYHIIPTNVTTLGITPTLYIQFNN